jgi:hypothetical protein
MTLTTIAPYLVAAWLALPMLAAIVSFRPQPHAQTKQDQREGEWAGEGFSLIPHLGAMQHDR